MNQPNYDVEAPVGHDQLPSVDEAKMNAAVAPAKSRNAIKGAIWIAVSVALLVSILFGVTIFVVSKENVSSLPPLESQSDAGDPQLEQVVQLLKNFSDYDLLMDPSSPQNRAANWIARDQLAQLYTINHLADQFQQRYVLALLFYSLDGEHWPDDLGFLSAKDVCQWYRTNLESNILDRSMFDGVWCKEDGKVQDLRFPQRYLSGSIPEELRFLTDLEVVDFGNNPGINGGFPNFVKSLPKLSFLGLQYCGITGELPDWLGTMASLESLVLSNNKFTGTLPPISQLTNLEYLYLDDNKLNGDVSIFGSLTGLKHLVLEDNSFHGSIDEGFVRQLSNLETFDGSHNQLGSTLPLNMWTYWANLKVVDLHGNKLTGLIPPVDSTHSSLQFLGLQDNQFTGELPSSLDRLTALQHLDLSNNRFESTLPESLGSLSTLHYLFVANNPLVQGEIPTFLMGLTSLADVSLKNTNRIGSIPDWKKISSLKLLDLGNNALTGTIPDSFGEMPSLKHLLLNRNKLEGNIPSNLSGLTTVLLDQNGLVGSTEEICMNEQGTPSVFTADCSGERPIVTCSCCTLCCEPGDATCNPDAWLADIDPIWEYSFKRGSGDYEFAKEP